MRTFPRATFKATTHDLMVCLFSLPASEICDLCGVGITTVEGWKNGSEPVPWMAFQLLRFAVLGRVPDFVNEWAGWRFVGDRLYAPGQTAKFAARKTELQFIDHYRIDRLLCSNQSELIDGLSRQRDFYKKQCGLEAKLGLMLHNLAG